MVEVFEGVELFLESDSGLKKYAWFLVGHPGVSSLWGPGGAVGEYFPELII